MRMKKTLLMAGLLLASAAPLTAWAGSLVEVGRVKLALQENGWEAVEAPPFQINIGPQGIDGVVDGQAKLLTLKAPDGKAVAVLWVGSTRGTMTQLRFSGVNDCRSVTSMYVHDYSQGRVPAECLFFGGPFKDFTTESLKNLPKLRAALNDDPTRLPPHPYVLVVRMQSSNASGLWMEGVVRGDLKGLAGKALEAVPAGLRPEAAAWAEALGQSSQEALHSIRGELRFPTLEFADR